MKRCIGIGMIIGISTTLFAQGVTLIPHEAVFKGTLRSRLIKIDGVFEGKLIADEDIEVSEYGEVRGTIEAIGGVIAGRVDGKVDISEELLLTSTAMVSGDVTARNLVTEKGALLTAKTSMGEIKRVTGEDKKPTAPTRTAPTTRSRTRERRRY